MYDQLPVYRKGNELFQQVFQVCRNMERDVMFTIGQRMQEEIIDLQVNVFRANCREDKFALIGTARENAEVIRLLLRNLSELKLISLEKFVDMNALLEEVSKQLTAWQKSVRKED